MIMMRIVMALALPCTIHAEYKLTPKDIELRPIQKISLLDEEQPTIDVSKINSSRIKQPVDILIESIDTIDQILANIREQISLIKNKR